jgi:hypothetical protein
MTTNLFIRAALGDLLNAWSTGCYTKPDHRNAKLSISNKAASDIRFALFHAPYIRPHLIGI